MMAPSLNLAIASAPTNHSTATGAMTGEDVAAQDSQFAALMQVSTGGDAAGDAGGKQGQGQVDLAADSPKTNFRPTANVPVAALPLNGTAVAAPPTAALPTTFVPKATLPTVTLPGAAPSVPSAVVTEATENAAATAAVTKADTSEGDAAAIVTLPLGGGTASTAQPAGAAPECALKPTMPTIALPTSTESARTAVVPPQSPAVDVTNGVQDAEAQPVMAAANGADPDADVTPVMSSAAKMVAASYGTESRPVTNGGTPTAGKAQGADAAPVNRRVSGPALNGAQVFRPVAHVPVSNGTLASRSGLAAAAQTGEAKKDSAVQSDSSGTTTPFATATDTAAAGTAVQPDAAQLAQTQVAQAQVDAAQTGVPAQPTGAVEALAGATKAGDAAPVAQRAAVPGKPNTRKDAAAAFARVKADSSAVPADPSVVAVAANVPVQSAVGSAAPAATKPQSSATATQAVAGNAAGNAQNAVSQGVVVPQVAADANAVHAPAEQDATTVSASGTGSGVGVKADSEAAPQHGGTLSSELSTAPVATGATFSPSMALHASTDAARTSAAARTATDATSDLAQAATTTSTAPLRHLNVQFNDDVLGTIGVRTEMKNGTLHASITGGQDVAAAMPELHQFLQRNDVAIHTVQHVAQPLRVSDGTSMTSSGNDGAGQNASGSSTFTGGGQPNSNAAPNNSGAQGGRDGQAGERSSAQDATRAYTVTRTRTADGNNFTRADDAQGSRLSIHI